MNDTEMYLKGIEIKNDPFWEFKFGNEQSYAKVVCHKNSEFANSFRNGNTLINFTKKVKLIVLP